MSSRLSGIPPQKRRHLAATLGLFAVLFVAVGSVAATGADTAAIKAFVAVAIVAALLLALMGWGVAVSIKQDVAEQSLDAAVYEVLAASPTRLCDCGHDHDPDELHLVRERLSVGDERGLGIDGQCAHDGHGIECSHSCDTCVLASLRTVAPVASEATVRPRPLPSRRPMPTAR